MNASAASARNALELDGLGVRPLGEKELVAISAGVGPAMAGFTLALGFVGLVAVGVAVGVAAYYFSH
jgi:hypothetical protein